MDKVGSIAIQVLPEVERDGIFDAVDEVIAYIQSTGLTYHVGPFETTVEGDFDSLMEVIRQAHEIILNSGIPGISAYIKTSFRTDSQAWSIEDKCHKYSK